MSHLKHPEEIGRGKGTDLGTVRRVGGKEKGFVQRARKGGWGKRRTVWGATCVRRAVA